MAEPFDELRAFIAYRVNEGFESAHEIIENAKEGAFDNNSLRSSNKPWAG